MLPRVQTSQFQKIADKNKNTLNKLLGKLKKIEDPTTNRHLGQNYMQEKVDSIEQNFVKTSETIQEYAKGEEGVDVVHVDEEHIQAFPNYLDQLTREVVAYREAHKGKHYPERTFEEWKESLVKEVSIELTHLKYLG